MKTSILVVEDDPPSRELLSDWLDLEGFTVFTAENLGRAFAVLRQQEVHVVFLDVQLGTEDGLEVARWIRGNPELRNLSVIAVTAHAMLTDRARVMQAGCNVCVSKPIDFTMLMKELTLCLSGRRPPD